ncbi:MAG: hypothetical protein AAB642_02305 [Patescibacteria group bacterium]
MFPKDDKKYSWTRHVVGKMQYYRLSESIIKRIIRHPKRVERGIAEGTVACMIPRTSAVRSRGRPHFIKTPRGRPSKGEELWVMYQQKGQRKHIITTWRYPGVSPVRDVLPIPQDILEEIKDLV